MRRVLQASLILVLLLLFGGSARAQAPGSVNWAGTPHGIDLTCTASTSTVAGYNFYRGTVTGGPYVKVNTSLLTACALLDSYSNLTVSTNYFYVATAVDASGNESVYSNQASATTPATFPTNPQAPTGLVAKPQ